VPQGRALNEVASRDCKVLVVGNPCNTNCLITMHNAPDLPKENFMSMTHLDHNRALAQLAAKANVPVGEVKGVAVWGNHSLFQVPDWRHATIGGKPVNHVIEDYDWLENAFVPRVQKRGAEVIAARGKSSAASAANAAIDAIRAITRPTPEDDWFSCGVCSDSNPYGFEENLIFSMPCRSKGDGTYEVVKDLPISANLRKKILKTQEELIAERELVADMLL
jgi:malate dehydrogenase